MRSLLFTVMAALAWTSGGGAFAEGGTSSGGGRIFKDLENPWFIGNTTTVRYCIDLAPEFGADLATARTAIRGALDQWVETLGNARALWYDPTTIAPYDALRLGTQTFVEAACDASTDLRFLLGKIDPADQTYVEQPTDFVAVTARTAYDPVNLRGKGFIYVAPETGPLRPDFPRLSTQPWSKAGGRVLRYVLTHELGHIFGISHAAGGIMEARRVEELVDERIVNALDTMPGVVTYYDDMFAKTNPFGFDTRHPIVECDDTPGNLTSWKFFGLGSDTTCWRLSLPRDTSSFAVEAGASATGPFTTAGRFHIDTVSTQNLALVYLWITPDQRVFTRLPSGFMGSDTLIAAAREQTRFLAGTFTSAGGVTRPVFIDANPNNAVRIGGMLNGSMNPSVYVYAGD